MTLDAAQLSLWRCERLGQFSRDWKPLRERPRSIFNRLARQMAFSISNSVTAAHAGHEAAISFLEKARNPGLDIEGSPYEVAQDYAHGLQNLAEWLGRTVLLPLEVGPIVRLTDSLSWRVSAFQDETGQLHRWTSSPRIDNDWVSRELHGWAVLGDAMAAGLPMMLHVVETGSVRKGHLHGLLSRIFQHPHVIGKFQFQKIDGSALEGDWKIRFAQDLRLGPPEWCDGLQRDQADPVRHLSIKAPDVRQRQQWIAQLENFIPRMAARQDPMSILGNPSICDSPLGPCQYQTVCFAPAGTTAKSAGGFVRLDSIRTSTKPVVTGTPAGL